jgi:hypothetical protein
MDSEDCTLVYFILAFLRGKAYKEIGYWGLGFGKKLIPNP